MYPISSIVPVEPVKMPDANDGAPRSLRTMLIIKTINMLLKSDGVRRIRITGSATGPHIRIIVKKTVKGKWPATANVVRTICDPRR